MKYVPLVFMNGYASRLPVRCRLLSQLLCGRALHSAMSEPLQTLAHSPLLLLQQQLAPHFIFQDVGTEEWAIIQATCAHPCQAEMHSAPTNDGKAADARGTQEEREHFYHLEEMRSNGDGERDRRRHGMLTLDDVREALQQMQHNDSSATVLQNAATLLIISGNAPLLTSESLARLLKAHAAQHTTITRFVPAHPSPTGEGPRERFWGEELRRGNTGIEKDAGGSMHSPAWCFDTGWMRQSVQYYNAKNSLEELLTLCAVQGHPTATVPLAAEEYIYVEDAQTFALAEQSMQWRIREDHMRKSVFFVDPATTYIEQDVQIGAGTRLLPGTMLNGSTTIGAECIVGPYSTISNCTVGDRCQIESSVLDGATLAEEVHVGPFAHIRPGTSIAPRVYIGNYAEVSRSTIGAETRMGHVSFLGDARVGERVNIGAGAITCNYDGQQKHHTHIGNDAFIGSDSMLVAPLTIGEHARTGAGSVVLHDVAPGETVAGVPAKVLEKHKQE